MQITPGSSPNPSSTRDDVVACDRKLLLKGRFGWSSHGRRGYVAVLSSLETRASGRRKGNEMAARTYESMASAAARMGVSVKTVRRRIADGVLPAYRCGRIIRLDPNEVDGMFYRSAQLTAAAPRGSTGRRPARHAN